MAVAIATPADPYPVSLEEAIMRQISLGQRDPLTIADKCASVYGGDWVAEQLASHWKEILAEIARQQLGSERRADLSAPEWPAIKKVE